MKVSVDFDLCDLNAVCMGICPEVFDVQGNELHVLQEEPGEELRESVKDAEDACPTLAITVSD
jgi:ferredoxin